MTLTLMSRQVVAVLVQLACRRASAFFDAVDS
jgi:hypothetical protein